MNYKLTLALFLVLIVLIGLPIAAARPTYFAAFKEKYNTSGTKLDTCNTCHTSGGGSPRNLYGLAFFDSGHDFIAIETLDSDNDGFTNIAEINALTFPGDANDNPQSNSNTNEKPITTATNAKKAPGFEAIIAVIGFFIIVGFHRKYA
ncbi:hypothetical protein [uncultured Methanomethylovorans sp.]|uniref:hypothetical protein n=1 Tax=uncultured Methanomethylovorans sp. TaxID=183759 RepID=UPI002AA6ABC8|nr:hypothetical protein [uncultured Methanomethylovorans sp.]